MRIVDTYKRTCVRKRDIRDMNNIIGNNTSHNKKIVLLLLHGNKIII